MAYDINKTTQPASDIWAEVLAVVHSFHTERAMHYTCVAPLFGPEHTHENRFHIAYVIGGDSQIRVNSQAYHVKPGDIVYIPAGQVHMSIGDANTAFELIEIHYIIPGRYHQVIPELPPVTAVPNQAELVPVLERLVTAHTLSTPENTWLAKILLVEAMLLLYQYGNEHSLVSPGTSDISRKINQAREYITLHPDQQISVEQLADLVGMSASHLAGSFKHIVGISPIQYLIHTRVQRARHLLSGSDFSIGQIAHICGFESPQYFARVFKRMEGLTPGHYRQKARQK